MASHQILVVYFICLLWYVVSCYVKPDLPSAKCKVTKLVVDQTCEQCYENLPTRTCSKFQCQDHNCKPETFSCYYVRKSGFDSVKNVFENYNKTEESLPELKRITWYKRPFNSSDGRILGNPALSLSVRLPCILHSGTQRSGSTNLLLMKFRSVEDRALRDDYYYRHIIHRLYNFTGLFRTTNDCHADKLVSFNCLLGLDVCGERRAYIVDLTAYAPEPRLYSTQRYMVTTFNTQTEWMPAIAATYKDEVVTVIFQADVNAKEYDVTLMDCDDHSTTVSEDQEALEACTDSKSIIRTEKGLKFDREDYKEVKFYQIPSGKYKVRITVKRLLSKTYESNVMIFGQVVDVPETEENRQDTEKTLIWVSTVGGGSVLAIILLIMIYFLRRKPIKGNVTARVFILYSNHYRRDCNMAKEFENFLDKVDGVQVLFDMSDTKYMSNPKEVHKEKMSACTHMMVIWSPGAREALSGGFLSQPETPVIDQFKSSLDWFSNVVDKKVFLVYLPEYETIESLKPLSKILRSVKKFNISKDEEVRKLCKHLVGRIPDCLITKAERRKAVKKIREKINSTHSCSIEDSDSERLELLPDSYHVRESFTSVCPIHGKVKNLDGARPEVKRNDRENSHTRRNFRKESPENKPHANDKICPLNNSRPNNYLHHPMKEFDNDETLLLRVQDRHSLQIPAEISENEHPVSFASYSSESFSSLGEEMARINFRNEGTSVLPDSNNSGNNSFFHITENPENIVLNDHARHFLPGTNIGSDESDEMDNYTSGYVTTSFQNQNMDRHNRHHPSQTGITTDVANDTTYGSNNLRDSVSSQIDNEMTDSSIWDQMMLINDFQL